MIQLDQYLEATDYLDYEDPAIQSVINSLALEGLDKIEIAKKIFYYVRDTFRYSIKSIIIDPATFKASNTVGKDQSFCIPKAVLLAAIARSQGIPSRLHFVDFVNHRLSDGLEKMWGTKIMASHCYAELFLNDIWVKATPSLDSTTCEKHRFVKVEFDGVHDGLLHSVDLDGKPHAEYVKDHGTHSDLPFDLIIQIFEATYGPIEKNWIESAFEGSVPTFE